MAISNSRRVCLAIFLSLIGIEISLGEVVRLVSPDGALPSVVASDKKPDQDAAADLCSYVSRVTGKTMAPSTSPADTGAVIHVGLDAFARQNAPEIDKLFADGYIIKCVTQGDRTHVILAGKQAPSATWAVEQFLKDFCGVRFLFPDPKYGEVVPSRPVLSIDSSFNKSFQPDYVSRYATSKAGHAYYTPNRMFLRGRTKWYDYGSHAIQYLFSEAEFKSHPEWFAFFNGKRQWWSYGNGWQICTTNPGTVEHAVKRALDFFEKNPDVPVFSVGLNDGYGWCECPECTKFVNSFNPPYTLSDRWFHWVNQVAHEVGRKYPDKWIETMAYASVSAPPRFGLEPNVAITETIVLPENLAEAEKWTKICRSVNLYSYMYGGSFLGFRHYPHAAKDFLKWGHDKLGALAHVTESGGDWTFDGPKFAYINALQWDVNTDVDALMADFCQSSYGAAAEPMKAFWDLLEKIYERRDSSERMAFYVWVGWQQQFNVQPDYELKDYTREDVQTLDKLMDQAVQLAAKDDSAIRFRVARMEEAWRYFRTAVISKLDYAGQPLPNRIASEQQLKEAAEGVRQISSLRAQREEMLSRMRLYPEINPNPADKGYWSSFSGMTLFNRELTLQDALIFEISQYLAARPRQSPGFWDSISPDDPLFETAQAQVQTRQQSRPANHFKNGGFEAGNADGWEVTGGQFTVANRQPRTGRWAGHIEGSDETALFQKIAVQGGQRYRLLGWGRADGALPKVAAPVDSIIEFYGDGQRIWYSEPVRNVPYAADAKGWLRVQSAFDVPPGADTAVVKLRKLASGAMFWDDLALDLVRDGAPDGGVVADDFDGRRLSRDKWFQAISSGGTPPRLADGWITFEKESCPIASHATFPNLLNQTDAAQCRLRLHIRATPAPKNPRFFKWGVQSGAGAVGTMEGTGIWWLQEFTAAGAGSKLLAYAHQNGKQVQSEIQDLATRSDLGQDLWYTLIFDRANVTLFISANGFSESEACRVSRFAHGITDLAANGRPRLKIEGDGCQLDTIELRTAKQPKGPTTGITNDPNDPQDRAMPGISN